MPKPFARPKNTRQLGNLQESLACQYLRGKGLRLVSSNYHCRNGEIDLIMLDSHQVLIFIEIRYRRQSGYGSAVETVDFVKQRKIRQAASHFLMTNPRLSHLACRFDVVGIESDGKTSRNRIQWISNAFS